MPLIPSNWAELLEPGLRDIIDLAYNRRPSLIPSLFDVMSSERAAEEFLTSGAMGIEQWEQFEQTGQIPESEWAKGYPVSFVHREFMQKLRIRQTLIEDNQYPQIRLNGQRLGDSAALKRETDAASVFNNAFSGSYVGGDAVSLCNASHPDKPGSSAVQSNAGSSTLSEASLKATREAMMAFKDDAGNKLGITPNTLLVPPELEDVAFKLIRSIQEPETANNAANPNFGRFTVLTWHFLSDSNNWFMLDSAIMNQNLKWIDRVPFGIQRMPADEPVYGTWLARWRSSYGWIDWRWLYGHSVS